MLHLPDVAQLMGDQVVRDVVAAKEDHAVRREAVIAPPGAQAEQPRRHDDADSGDANRARPPVELVEARFGGDEPCVWRMTQRTIGSRTRTADRSCAWVYSYR